MKTKFLIIISVLVLFPIQLVYAPPPAPDPEDDFRYSAHVITGKIISSEIIKDPREDNSAETFYDIIIYQVKVEEWHKNPLENDIITVYGTHYPNDVIPEPDWGVVEFEIGDTVYLYINETDDGLEFRKYASKLLQKYVAEELTPHPYTDDSNFEQSAVIIAVLIGVGSGIGLTFYWRKRKWKYSNHINVKNAKWLLQKRLDCYDITKKLIHQNQNITNRNGIGIILHLHDVS